jgi:hypothetical protein
MTNFISKIEKAVLVSCAFALFAGILWTIANVISEFNEYNGTQVFDAILFIALLLVFQVVIFAMLWVNKNN